jgi:chlorobactene glucosyltransferase
VPFLFTLPWVALAAFLALRIRLPRELPPAAPGADAPTVSVVVPARNEAANVERCLRSLAASDYPSFEVIVVDDRSEDDTAALARAVDRGRAERVEVVQGEELPDGWLGKPWACAQGAAAARGDVLLFTDADTVHEPDLLGRAVAGLVEDRADLLTVAGRQIMGSFWERLMQPQIFLTMAIRFYDIEASIRRGRWRDGIANGQFMLFPRASYEALGGHDAVRDEIVEDLAFGQLVLREGRRLSVRMGEELLATRMYRSLGELVRGWSKNILLGGLQSLPPASRAMMAPLSLAFGVGLWLLPPLALAAAAFGVVGGGATLWAGTAVALSLLTWGAVYHRMGAPARFALLYPLGAAVGTYIFVRSWRGGRDVEWKGRRYRVRDVAERA